jgi:hypothetical protein
LTSSQLLPTVVEGPLSRVEMADAADTCFGADSPRVVMGEGTTPSGSVLALQVTADGVVWDVGLGLPGIHSHMLMVGDTVSIAVHNEFEEGSVDRGQVIVRHQGAFLVGVGMSEMDGMTIAAGAEECEQVGADCCAYTGYDMDVQVDGESAVLERNASAQVGGLLVTNDQFAVFFDNGDGCCNFGGTAYLVGATAQ